MGGRPAVYIVSMQTSRLRIVGVSARERLLDDFNYPTNRFGFSTGHAQSTAQHKASPIRPRQNKQTYHRTRLTNAMMQKNRSAQPSNTTTRPNRTVLTMSKKILAAMSLSAH